MLNFTHVRWLDGDPATVKEIRRPMGTAFAEVIDGRPVGTTPLANLSLPIGSHEIVWKHPQLGERRQTVTVTASMPARIGVDFSR